MEQLETRLLFSFAPTINLVQPNFPTLGIDTGFEEGSDLTLDAVPPLKVKIVFPSYLPPPTGTVSLLWYGGQTIATMPLTTGVAFPSATFNLQSPITGAVAANVTWADPIWNGDGLIEAFYSGDGTYSSGYSLTPQEISQMAKNQFEVIDALHIDLAVTTYPNLVFLQQPTGTSVNTPIAPPVEVAVEDENTGAIVTDAAQTVVLTLGGADGTLAGTTSVHVTDGIAKFDNLSVTADGTYTLTASASYPNANSATSNEFSIGTAAGNLAVHAQPSTGSAGVPLSPPFSIQLRNGKHHVITTNSSSTVTITPIGAEAGAAISGNTATFNKGVATFPNLILPNPGTYTLQVTDGGDVPIATKTIRILGDHLVFKREPTSSDANVPLSFTVALEDAKNRVVTSDSTDAVTVGLDVLAGGSGATLAGMVSITLVNGLAVFTPTQKVSINAIGAYSLTADVAGNSAIGSASSKAFKIGGYHLVFVKEPARAAANQPLAFSVAIEDQKHKIVASGAGDTLSLTLEPLGAAVGVLSPFNDAGFINGIDTVSAASGLSINDAGDYVLLASVAGPDALLTTSAKSKALKIS